MAGTWPSGDGLPSTHLCFGGVVFKYPTIAGFQYPEYGERHAGYGVSNSDFGRGVALFLWFFGTLK